VRSRGKREYMRNRGIRGEEKRGIGGEQREKRK
jgi:hypothetical protein